MKNWEIDCIPVKQTYPQENYNIAYCNIRISAVLKINGYILTSKKILLIV